MLTEDVPSKGACFYESVSVLEKMEDENAGNWSAQDYRNLVVAKAKTSLEEAGMFKIYFNSEEEFQMHVQKQALPTTWASGAWITVTALVLKRNILIITPWSQEGKPFEVVVGARGSNIHKRPLILYYAAGVHYRPLVLRPDMDLLKEALYIHKHVSSLVLNPEEAGFFKTTAPESRLVSSEQGKLLEENSLITDEAITSTNAESKDGCQEEVVNKETFNEKKEHVRGNELITKGQNEESQEPTTQGRKLDLDKPNQTELERIKNLVNCSKDDLEELSKDFIVTTLKSSLGLLTFEKAQVDKYVTTLERWVTVLESRLCEAGLLDAEQTGDMEPASLKFTQLNFKIDKLMGMLGEKQCNEQFVPGPTPSPVAMPAQLPNNGHDVRTNGISSLSNPGGRIMPDQARGPTGGSSITTSVAPNNTLVEPSKLHIMSNLPDLNILNLGLVLNCYCRLQKDCGDRCFCCRFCIVNNNHCGAKEKRKILNMDSDPVDKVWSEIGQEASQVKVNSEATVPADGINLEEIFESDIESDASNTHVVNSFSGGSYKAVSTSHAVTSGILSGGLISAEVFKMCMEKCFWHNELMQEGNPALAKGNDAAVHLEEYFQKSLGKSLTEVAAWMTDLAGAKENSLRPVESPDSGVASASPQCDSSDTSRVKKSDLKKILSRACYKCNKHLNNVIMHNSCLDSSIKSNSPLRWDANWWDIMLTLQFRRPRLSRSKERSKAPSGSRWSRERSVTPRMGPPPPRVSSTGSRGISTPPRSSTKRAATRSPSCSGEFRPRTSTASSSPGIDLQRNCELSPVRRSRDSEASDVSMTTARSSPQTVPVTSPEVSMLSKSALVWWNRTPDNVFTFGSASEMDTTAGSSRTDDWSSGYALPFAGGKSQHEIDNQPSITMFLSKNSVYKKQKKVVKKMKRRKKEKSQKKRKTMKNVSGTITNTKTESSSLGTFSPNTWL